MTMKIQYASDLHLEFDDNWRYLREHPLPVVGDILVLAGDIGYFGDDNYTLHPFWNWASDNFSEVYVCPGNHEFYKFYDLASMKDGDCMEIRKNVHCYYNAVVHVDGIDIILSTLWGNIPLKEAFYTEQVISDFRRIMYHKDLLTFSDFNRENQRCVSFVQTAVASSKATTKIVVTHHVPSYRMQCPEFAGSQANGAFNVELEDYIEQSGIDFWIYGHSHYNKDVRIGNTLCLSNQLGYVFHQEHKTFVPDKCIEID